MPHLLKETLGDYIRRIREANGWSRDLVADRAKRAGHRLSGSYVAKLERGESAPTIDYLKALAIGLQVDEDTLIRIARGQGPEAAPAAPGKTGDPPILAEVNSFGELEYPPTEQERTIIEEAASYGMDRWPFMSEPGFWSRMPDERRSSFLLMQAAVEEAKRYYRSQGGR